MNRMLPGSLPCRLPRPTIAILSAVAAIGLLASPLRADFEDTFSGASLGAGWTTWDGYALANPGDAANHAAFSVGGGHLSISFPGVQEHNQWWLEHAQVQRTYFGSGTYEIKVDGGFNGSQQVGIVFQREPGTFMMFMLYATNQVYAYIERFSTVGGELHKSTVAGVALGIGIPEPGPHYLRVAVQDNADPTQRTWRFDWSDNGSDWIELFADTYEGAASSTNIGTIQTVGVFAGNQPPGFSAYNAQIDYFRYTESTPPNNATAQNLVGRTGDGSVELWWDALPSAQSYAIHRSTGGGPILLGTTTETSWIEDGLTNDVAHEFYVTPTTAQGAGLPSLPVTLVPHPSTSFQSLPADGLLLALDADELAYTHPNGAPVTTWVSAIGARSVASAPSSRAPTFVASAINGQAAVRFDGVNDYLSMGTGFENFTGGVSIYVVMRPVTLQTGFKILALGNGANQQNIVLGRAGSTNGLQYFTNNAAGAVDWFNTASGLSTGDPFLISLVQQAGPAGGTSQAVISRNGIQVGGDSVFVPHIAPRGVNHLGNSYWNEGMLHGDVAKVLVYNRVLSPQEQASLHALVSQSYGFAVGDTPPPQPPQAPASLSATGGNAVVNLSWSASAGASGYTLSRRTLPSGSFAALVTTSNTSHADLAVTNGTSYEYVVVATNAAGNSSASPTASATPAAPPPQPPLPPASLSATAGDALVNLSWPASTGATSYAVSRRVLPGGSFSVVASTAATGHLDQGLVNGTPYEYVVTASNASGTSSPSPAAQATPEAPPAPGPIPTNGLILRLNASSLVGQVSAGQPVTTWSDLSGTNNHATALANSAPAFQTAAIGGQPAVRFDGVDDYFSLPSGFSDFTSGISLFVVMRPSALQPGFKIVALGSGANQRNIVFGRAGSSSGLQYFTNNSTGSVGWFNTATGLAAGQSMVVSVVQSGGAANATSAAQISRDGTVVGGNNVFVPPTLQRTANYIGRSYWTEGWLQGDVAEVILYNRALSVPEQAAVQAYVAGTYGIGAPPPAAPQAPATLIAEADDAAVVLGWSSAATATGYRLYRRTPPATAFTLVSDGASLEHTDSGLSNGVTYEYVVTAYNAGGESPQSAIISATPEATPAPPSAPASLQAQASNASVALSWPSASGADGYRLYRRVPPVTTFELVVATSSLDHQDSGLTNGVTYEYAVSGYNTHGESALSPVASATPAEPPPVAIPGQGLILSLDATTLAGSLQDGASVQVWSDTSGSNNHATAGAGAPSFVAAGIGGQPSVRFDGVDDSLNLPAGFSTFTEGISLFVVMRPSALQPGFKILALGNGANQQNIVLGRAGSTAGFQFFTNSGTGAVTWFNTNGGLTAGASFLVSVEQDGGAASSLSTTSLHRDGVLQGGANLHVPPVASRSVNYIGRSYWNEGRFQGDMAELLLYNRKLSGPESAAVRQYLATKYGLPHQP